MPIKAGYQLTAAQRTEVFRTFVHRHTIENAIVRGGCVLCLDGHRLSHGLTLDEWHARHIAPVTDAQWLDTHAFYITRTGRLDDKHNYAAPVIMAEQSDVRDWKSTATGKDD